VERRLYEELLDLEVHVSHSFGEVLEQRFVYILKFSADPVYGLRPNELLFLP